MPAENDAQDPRRASLAEAPKRVAVEEVRLLPSRRGCTVALLMAFGTLAGLALLIAVASAKWLPSLFALPFLAVGAAALWRRSRGKLGDAEYWVAHDKLHVRGATIEHTIPLETIAWGAARGQVVELHTRDGARLSFVAPSEDAAQAFLNATETNVQQAVFRVPLRGTIGTPITGVLWFFGLLWPTSAILAKLATAILGKGEAPIVALVTLVPMICLALSWWLARAMEPSLTVGIDGLTIKGRITKRFIPHDAIVECTPVHIQVSSDNAHTKHLLRVVLDGETIDLPILTWDDDDVQRVLERMKQAKETLAAQDKRDVEAFARMGRGMTDWRLQLKRALSGDAGFRSTRVSVEDARRVLADPDAVVEHRVGAALALGQVEPEAARKRIRFAADASANERVRVMLLATLEDDEALEQALLDEASRTVED